MISRWRKEEKDEEKDVSFYNSIRKEKNKDLQIWSFLSRIIDKFLFFNTNQEEYMISRWRKEERDEEKDVSFYNSIRKEKIKIYKLVLF